MSRTEARDRLASAIKIAKAKPSGPRLNTHNVGASIELVRTAIPNPTDELEAALAAAEAKGATRIALPVSILEPALEQPVTKPARKGQSSEPPARK